jgi:hypothetical protein
MFKEGFSNWQQHCFAFGIVTVYKQDMRLLSHSSATNMLDFYLAVDQER